MKRRTSITKKLMALCLVLVCMLSMSMNAFAAITADTKGTVTVHGQETDNGAEISAYKIINVNYDVAQGQLEEPVYTWADSVAKWVKDNYPEYINADDNSVTETYMGLNAKDAGIFYKKMREAKILGEAAGTATMADKTATFQLEMGQYVLLATKDVDYVYAPATANVYPVYENDDWIIPAVDVTLKGSAPGITKEVEPNAEGQADKTVAIGDIVPYVIKADIPVYPEDATATMFKVSDKLSDGLTLNANSIQVLIGETELDATTGVYTLDLGVLNQDRTFEITFDYDLLKAAAGDATEVTVKYNAVVNEKAFTVDKLGNKAFAGYNTDPYDEGSYVPGEGTEETVYTYGIDLTKVDKDNLATGLAGAEFELRTDAAGEALEFVEVEAGVYRPVIEGETEATTTTTLIVSDDGKLQIQGIDLGTYYLKETKAPAGYVLPNKDVVIVLGDSDVDGMLDGSTVTIEKSDVASVENITVPANNKKIISFNLTNTSSDDEGFVLPTTGGAGTLLFSVIGIVLMGAAVTLIVVFKKRQSN